MVIFFLFTYLALKKQLYAKEVATWVKAIRWVLTFYPPFNLALAFNNIAVLSSKTIDISSGTITQVTEIVAYSAH